MTPPIVLLAALEDFLRDDFSGQLSPYQAYQARIAANLLALLRREAAEGPLLAALDKEFAEAQGLDPARMPAALALALRDNTLEDPVAIRDYLRRRSLLSLAIDNPRYSGYQQAREAWPKLAEQLATQLDRNSNGYHDTNQHRTTNQHRDASEHRDTSE